MDPCDTLGWIAGGCSRLALRVARLEPATLLEVIKNIVSDEETRASHNQVADSERLIGDETKNPRQPEFRAHRIERASLSPERRRHARSTGCPAMLDEMTCSVGRVRWEVNGRSEVPGTSDKVAIHRFERCQLQRKGASDPEERG